MSPTPTPHDVQMILTADELRDWFDANHLTADELWLGYPKKSSGIKGLTWSEAVDEALCVGWIDGVRYSIDERTHAQRFTPRRKGSNWSDINVAKVAVLTEQGRMRPAGIAAFEARTPERTGSYSYERDAATFSADELATFRANEAAWTRWERDPPGYRKTATHWVASAKREETRTKRMTELIELTAVGDRPRQFRVRRA